MKTNSIQQYIFGSLSLLLLAVYACDDDNEKYYKHNTALSPIEHLSNDTTLDIIGTTLNTIAFNWTPSKAADYSSVFYKVHFIGENGDFDNPEFIQTTTRLGSDSYVLITDSTLNVIAESCGIRPGQGGKIHWKVYASNGIAQTSASQHSTITVNSRPNTFAIQPDEIFILGSATSAGEKIEKAIKGRYDSINQSFDFFIPLKQGEFYFVDNTSTKYRLFGINTDRVEQDYKNQLTSTTEKMYRLSLNFRSTAAAFCEIIKIEPILTSGAQVLAELDYTQNSIWEKEFTMPTGISAVSSYKIQLTERKMVDDATSLSYWGSKNDKGSTPPDLTLPTSPTYYHVVMSSNATNAFYRFPSKISFLGKKVKFTLTMTPGIADYYHSLVLSE